MAFLDVGKMRSDIHWNTIEFFFSLRKKAKLKEFHKGSFVSK